MYKELLTQKIYKDTTLDVIVDDVLSKDLSDLSYTLSSASNNMRSQNQNDCSIM
jgi:hypothetical protein